MQLPGSPFSFSLNDWQRFNVVSTLESSTNVIFQGEIKHGQSGDFLAGFTSGQVSIEPGLTSISASNLLISNLQTNAGNLSGAFSAGKGLPPGSYIACINVLDMSGQALGSSCREVEVKPISVPVLVYPQNASTISEKQPIFTWVPALIEGSSTGLEYHVSLYEVRLDQSSFEAASRNRPIFEAKVKNGSSQLAYPSGATLLAEGKRYIWRVSTFYKGYLLGLSEMHSFEIGEMERAIEVSDTLWVQLDPHRTMPSQTCTEVIRVNFKYYLPKEDIKVNIRNAQGRVYALKTSEFVRRETNGEVIINLSELQFVEGSGTYQLEFIRQNSQRLRLNLNYKE